MPPLPGDEALAQAIRSVLPQARAAWLFGSAARNALRDDSDIDLAVDLPHPLAGLEKREASERLAAQWSRDVDLLDFRRLHTVMQFQVLDTGRLIFAADPAALQQYNGFVFTEYQNIQRWRRPMMVQLAERLSQPL